MPTVSDVLDALEEIAPRRFAFDFDRIGLQVGDSRAHVERAIVSLDRSRAAVAFAAEKRAQLLLSHHPLLFQPIDSVVRRGHVGNTLFDLIENRIAFIAAHTNWDCAQGGINDALAAKLGLSGVVPFGSASEIERLKMVVTAPVEGADGIVAAASDAGAGKIGMYSRCAFMSEGTGTFHGEKGSNPSIGEPGRIERAHEVRIEMTLRGDNRKAVEAAVRKAHSYEEPAIDFFHLTGGQGHPAGRVGSLKRHSSLRALMMHVQSSLETKALLWGDGELNVKRIAVVGGAADGEWVAASKVADVLITGEVKQHVALEALESGFPMIAAGHYATEQPGCAALRDRMAAAIPAIEWFLYEPEKGQAGRPL